LGCRASARATPAAAIGHTLVERGRSVLFVPTYQLVQEMLAAKRDLVLPKIVRKLDLFDLLIFDDIGYVEQSPDEAEVLFTLMADRYERRSLLITSNCKTPMTTAARHRPARAPLGDPRVRRPQLPRRGREARDVGGGRAADPREEIVRPRDVQPSRSRQEQLSSTERMFDVDHAIGRVQHRPADQLA
jgi:IstB-like ATP binding protein